MKQIALISIIFFSFFATVQAGENISFSGVPMVEKGCGYPFKKKKLFKTICEKLGVDFSKPKDKNSYYLTGKSSSNLKKTRAVLMAILTGPLGGHRLYLGTKSYVPIVYTLTLGGGMGLLPLIDVCVILFTDDLSKYQNCEQIIMWGE